MFDPRYSHDDPRRLYEHERAWQEYYTGLSPSGVLVPPIGIVESLRDAFGGKLQMPGGLGTLVPSMSAPFGHDDTANKSQQPTDWSTAAKVGVVVGGALLLYLIFTASRAAAPVATRIGNVAASYLPEPKAAPKKRRAPRAPRARTINARFLPE